MESTLYRLLFKEYADRALNYMLKNGLRQNLKLKIKMTMKIHIRR